MPSLFTDRYPDRRSIRAILFDQSGQLVFLGLHVPGKPVIYLTFGGGVELVNGVEENPEVTLRRELLEELDAHAEIGREMLAVPAHRYHAALVTNQGTNPFTLGPEFQEGRRESYEIKRVSFEAAMAPDFNLQPALLKPFLSLYRRILEQELTELRRRAPESV